MSSHNEAGGSGRAGDGHFQKVDEYFNYLEQCKPGTQGGSETNPDTATDSGTCTDTAPKFGDNADLVGEGPKTKRARKPNELDTGQIVVTAMHPTKLEPTELEKASKCYDNQL